MGLMDKLDNKVKHYGSKQNENSEINSLNKKIKAEEDAIDVKNADIGEFYWNLYAKGEFTPVGDSADLFKAIEESLKAIDGYKSEIDQRKTAGEEERKKIDEDLKAKEEQKAAEAEERRKRQEEERKARQAEAEAAKQNKE
jgi:zinc finger CCCH domain-containing protein 13